MKRKNQMVSDLGGYYSRANLGDRLSRYRDKLRIDTQGASACTLFYIQEGWVLLTGSTDSLVIVRL
jgi:hypothetical protein